MKFVFTIKPSGNAVENDPSTWYKRKARLVICGNMATEGDTSLYTETAPAEVVRSALAVTSRNAWSVAILDVVAAFSKDAPWSFGEGPSSHSPATTVIGDDGAM